MFSNVLEEWTEGRERESKRREGEREDRKRESMETVRSSWKIPEALRKQGSVFIQTTFDASSRDLGN